MLPAHNPIEQGTVMQAKSAFPQGSIAGPWTPFYNPEEGVQ